MPSLDIRPDHLHIVRDILQKHVPNHEVWAFGSRAKWTARETSDLDLCVQGDEPLSFESMGLLRAAFEESDLPYKVDVVDWATTSGSFRKIIERDRVVVQTARRAARSTWRTMAIEDCMAAIIDYRGKTPTKTTSGIPLITAKIVKGGRFTEPDEFIAEDAYEQWMTRGLPMKGDVVLTTEAPLGEVAQLDGRKVALAQRIITLRGKPGLLDNTYLKFVLQSHLVQARLSGRASGSTVSGIKQSELRKVELPIPSWNEQLGIAHILGSIDEKIELNRRINQTLEIMAQAIFKSWFVDFDPVKAKIAAQTEGCDPLRAAMRAISGRTDAELDALLREQYDQLAATAALFPDEMEESELGEIPKGWDWTPFGNLITRTIGGDWGGDKPDEINDTRVAIIRGTDIPDLHSAKTNRVPIRYTSNKKLLSRRLEVGDIVLEVSGGSTDQPTGRSLYLSKNVLSRFDCPVEPASFCRLLRPVTPDIGVLLGQHLVHIYSQGKTWQYQNQSTGIANFQTTHFLENENVALPTTDIVSAFSLAVSPLLERGHDSQIFVLAALRDSLLPKLLSGELAVSASESLIFEGDVE